MPSSRPEAVSVGVGGRDWKDSIGTNHACVIGTHRMGTEVGSLRFAGETFHFCSTEVVRRFASQPENFAAAD